MFSSNTMTFHQGTQTQNRSLTDELTDEEPSESATLNDDDNEPIDTSDEENLPRSNRKKFRRQRHVGPHDDGGLQRTISTGNDTR